MAILVDEARWPWRGTTWCHLVTDSHLEELHEFARELGCRRIGFQGDHYDIDAADRERAIAAGAVATTSRDVVRRLRLAGLRLRPSQFEKWQFVAQWAAPLATEELAAVLTSLPQAGALDPDRLEAAITVAEGAFCVSRRTAAAVVVHGTGAVAPIREDPTQGLYSRVDRRGRWAVESTTAPLAAAE